MLVNSVLFFLVCRLTEHDMIYDVFTKFSLRKLQCCEKVFDPLIDFLVFCIVLMFEIYQTNFSIRQRRCK